MHCTRPSRWAWRIDLLGGDLRIRVRDERVAHRVALVDTVGELEPEHRDRGEVHEPPRAGALCGLDRVRGPEHVRTPHVVAALEAQRDRRGGVDHELAARCRVLPRARLGHIPGHDLSRRVADQVTASDLVPVGRVALAERPADESGCPGDEHAHARRIYPVGGIVGIVPPKTSHSTRAPRRAGLKPRPARQTSPSLSSKPPAGRFPPGTAWTPRAPAGPRGLRGTARATRRLRRESARAPRSAAHRGGRGAGQRSPT